MVAGWPQRLCCGYLSVKARQPASGRPVNRYETGGGGSGLLRLAVHWLGTDIEYIKIGVIDIHTDKGREILEGQH